MSNPIKFVITSDTHGFHSVTSIPKCDFLIYCGDYSQEGNEKSSRSFAKWLSNQKATHKIIVMGNHERRIASELPESKRWILDECPDCHFLINESVVIDDFFFYGSSYHFVEPENFEIPENKKFILVTHEPPYNILDEMVVKQTQIPWKYFRGGNGNLNSFIEKYPPHLHCFGHCHHCYGSMRNGNTLHINASRVTEILIPWNKPWVVTFENNEFIYH